MEFGTSAPILVTYNCDAADKNDHNTHLECKNNAECLDGNERCLNVIVTAKASFFKYVPITLPRYCDNAQLCDQIVTDKDKTISITCPATDQNPADSNEMKECVPYGTKDENGIAYQNTCSGDNICGAAIVPTGSYRGMEISKCIKKEECTKNGAFLVKGISAEEHHKQIKELKFECTAAKLVASVASIFILASSI